MPVGASDGAGLAQSGRKGLGGHLVGGLGHAVGLDHGGAERLLDALEDDGRKGGGGGADEAQARPGERLCVAPGAGENELVHGGDSRVPGGLEGIEPVEEAEGVEVAGAGDGAACGEGSQQSGDEPVDMEEGHHQQAAVVGGEGERLGDVGGGDGRGWRA